MNKPTVHSAVAVAAWRALLAGQHDAAELCTSACNATRPLPQFGRDADKQWQVAACFQWLFVLQTPGLCAVVSNPPLRQPGLA